MGISCSKENKSKAKERLSQAKFNIQWNTSMNKKSTSAMLKSPLGVLIDLTEKGDLQKILLPIVQCQRSENQNPNINECQERAKKLYDSGVKDILKKTINIYQKCKI